MWYLRLYYVAIFTSISLERSDQAISFRWDPDLGQIKIGSGFGSRSRALLTKNCEKNIAENFFLPFFDKKLHFSHLYGTI
jgi:hypothetical protein